MLGAFGNRLKYYRRCWSGNDYIQYFLFRWVISLAKSIHNDALSRGCFAYCGCYDTQTRIFSRVEKCSTSLYRKNILFPLSMALAGSRIPILWYGWTCYTLRFTSLPLRDFRAGQPFLSVFGKSYPQTAAIDSAGKRFLVYHNLYNSCDRSWCNYLSLRRIPRPV